MADDDEKGESRTRTSRGSLVWYSTIPKPSPHEPVKIHWKVYFNELYGIDSVSQIASFYMFFALYWKDDRIIERNPEIADENAWNAYKFKDGINEEDIWIPHVELVNAADGAEVSEEAREVVMIPGQGPFVIQHNVFKGSVSAPMSLKQFPFDQQVLPVKFRSYMYPLEDCVLFASERDAHSMMQCLDKRMSSTEFHIRHLRAVQDAIVYPMLAEIEGEKRATYCEYRLEFLLERKPSYYMHKVWLQFNFIAVMDFFCALLIQYAIGDRNSVALTLFLTAVALSFAVAGDLPKISYRTRMDSFILANYFILFTIFVSNFFVYFWYDVESSDHWQSTPTKIQIGFSTFIAICWLLSNLWFVMPLFFRGRRNDDIFNEIKTRRLTRGNTAITRPTGSDQGIGMMKTGMSTELQ